MGRFVGTLDAFYRIGEWGNIKRLGFLVIGGIAGVDRKGKADCRHESHQFDQYPVAHHFSETLS